MYKDIKSILNDEKSDYNVEIRGWVRTLRQSKDIVFVEVNDGSSISNIQVVADKNHPLYDKFMEITTGSSLMIKGRVIPSPAKGQRHEVYPEELMIYGTADPNDYPLQKKRHSWEFLRKIAHLRVRTNTFGCINRLRSSLAKAIHTYFWENNFYYIHPPILSGSDCEGGGEMFQVTTLDLDSLPKENKNIDYSRDFFGKKAHLTVSGQLEAEVLALGLGKVYTFAPTFRAENSNTARHLSEFWMIEPEMAFFDIFDDMDLAEDFLKSIINKTMNECAEEYEFFSRFIEKDLEKKLRVITDNSFERITYTKAVEILEKNNKNFEFKVEWGCDLQSEHEKYLTETVFKKPVIVYDYPEEIKAFYMRLNADERTVAAMDILVPRIGEIIGGSQREERYDVLLRRIREKGLKEDDYWWYMDLRRFGSVPHSGFGLGFERMLQFLTGMANIRDVIPFPRVPGLLEF